MEIYKNQLKTTKNQLKYTKSYQRSLKTNRNPQEIIGNPLKSIKIHQIRPIDLVNAVDSKVAITQLLDFIGSRTIIGYYIKFDMTIISKYTKKYIGVKLPNKSIEVSSLYYKSRKKTSPYDFIDLKFDTIMKELQIPELGKHDALNDAIMTAMIFLKLQKYQE